MINQKKKQKEITENFLEKKFFAILEELKKKEKVIDITITTKTEEKTIKRSFVAVPELKLKLENFKKRNKNFKTLKKFDLVYKGIKLGNLKFFIDKNNSKNIGISIFLLPLSSETPMLFIIPLKLFHLKRIIKRLADVLQDYKDKKRERGRKTVIFKLLRELEDKIIETEIKNITENELIKNELRELYEKIINKLNEINELIKEFVKESLEELEINNEKIENAIQNYYMFLMIGMTKEEAIEEAIKINDLNEIEARKFIKFIENK